MDERKANEQLEHKNAPSGSEGFEERDLPASLCHGLARQLLEGGEQAITHYVEASYRAMPEDPAERVRFLEEYSEMLKVLRDPNTQERIEESEHQIASNRASKVPIEDFLSQLAER